MAEAKLKQEAANVGATVYQKKPPLAPPEVRATALVDGSAIAEVTRLLSARKRASSDYKDPTTKLSRHFKSQKRINKELDTSLWNYTDAELNAALQDALDGDKSVSVIAALIHRGACVNLKKALPRATRLWKEDLIRLILSHCGKKDNQSVLDAALAAAIAALSTVHPTRTESRHIGVISALVSSGAKVERDSLKHVVAARNGIILDVLLRGPKPVVGDDLSKFLIDAMQQQHYGMLSLLLAYGANPDHGTGGALVQAIVDGEYKFAIAVLANTSHSGLSQESLSVGLKTVLSSDRIQAEEHLKWLRLLFLAGAPSTITEISVRLSRAVSNSEVDLVRLLVENGADITSPNANALETAIANHNLPMISQLLKTGGAHSPSSLADLLARVPQEFGGEDRIRVTTWILNGGASGTGLNEAFVSLIGEIVRLFDGEVSSDEHQRLLKLFLDHDANIDWDNGVVLKDAFAARNTYIVRHLCLKSPNKATLAATLALLHNGFFQNLTLPSVDIVENVLRCYPTQETLNETLLGLVREAPHNDRLISLLLRYEADVCFQQGMVIQEAIRTCDEPVFSLLVEHVSRLEIIGMRFYESLVSVGKAGILLKKYWSQSAVDEALSRELNSSQVRYDVLQFLIGHKASIDHDGGAAFQEICQRQDLKAMSIVLKSGSDVTRGKALCSTIENGVTKRVQICDGLLATRCSQKHIDDALLLAVTKKHTSRTDDRLELMQLLLQHGADVNYGSGAALKAAIAALERGLIPILVKSRVNMTVVDQTFSYARLVLRSDDARHFVYSLLLSSALRKPTELENAIIDLATSRSDHDELWKLLLSQGADTQALSVALKNLVDAYGTTEPPRKYVAKLLEQGADVDAFNGYCLHKSAEFRHRDIFLQLTAHSTNPETLTSALASTLSSGMSEEDILETIDTMFKQETKPSVREAPGKDALSYLSIYYYPQSHRILQTLVRYGFSIEWERDVIVWPAVGEEKANALLWTVTPYLAGTVTIDVLQALLEAEAGVDFSTRHSRITPLMIAASNKETLLFSTFLQHNPNIDLVDQGGRTAQSYASESGGLEMVQWLCERGASKVDGSLHEAARELHHPVVQYLIGQGYDPDEPSTLHEGRSALHEILLKTQILPADSTIALSETIKLLLDHGADPNIPCATNEYKNALYCAFDNDHPFPILEAFLNTGQWKNLNDKRNWYTDSTGHCYSAKTYVERGPWKGKPADRARLIDLLKMKRCQDRYFVWEGEQPADAVGLPEDLKEKHEQRKAIREEHRFNLELARVNQEQQLALTRETNALSLQHERERNEAQRREADATNQQSLCHEAALSTQRQTALQAENDMAFTQQKRLTALHEAEREHSTTQELKRLEAKSRADEQRIKRLNESDRLRNGYIMGQIKAQRQLLVAGHNGAQLQIMDRAFSLRSRSEEPD